MCFADYVFVCLQHLLFISSQGREVCLSMEEKIGMCQTWRSQLCSSPARMKKIRPPWPPMNFPFLWIGRWVSCPTSKMMTLLLPLLFSIQEWLLRSGKSHLFLSPNLKHFWEVIFSIYVKIQQLTDLLSGNQKLKPDLNMEEIGLSTFDGEKKSETSGKSKINLPQYVIVNWHWNIIRNTFSFVLFSAILGAFSASAILIAHLPRRCDPSTEWWQGKIFYEIFPTSFHDSDNNGVHNLNGVILKLDYLSNKLNVDAVHLNSIFEASDYPSSYLDIINCTKVDPLLGDMKTFQDLVTSITKRNMSLVLDIHVDRLPGISGASVLSEEPSLIVEDTMKFWLHRGVHGFFLKVISHRNLSFWLFIFCH